jgi:DNA-binding LytR/AlgR family response regulator
MHLILKTRNRLLKIEADSVLSIESYSKETNLILQNGKAITVKPISSLQNLLLEDFIQISRSVHVNLNVISNVIFEDGFAYVNFSTTKKKYKVSRNYKSEFLDKFKKNGVYIK